MKKRMIEFKAWEMPHGTITGGTNIQLISGLSSIRQSIVMLLSTMPGERVMRPAYGCPLNELAFAPNDDTTAGLAMHYIREAIENWEPRIEIVKLDAGPAPEKPDSLLIDLEYRTRTAGETDQLQFQYNLSGENE